MGSRTRDAASPVGGGERGGEAQSQLEEVLNRFGWVVCSVVPACKPAGPSLSKSSRECTLWCSCSERCTCLPAGRDGTCSSTWDAVRPRLESRASDRNDRVPRRLPGGGPDKRSIVMPTLMIRLGSAAEDAIGVGRLEYAEAEAGGARAEAGGGKGAQRRTQARQKTVENES